MLMWHFISLLIKCYTLLPSLTFNSELKCNLHNLLTSTSGVAGYSIHELIE